MARHSTATEDRGVKKVTQQPHRFAGLFLMPFVGLVVSWLIHIYTAGVTFGEIRTPGSVLGTWVVSALIIGISAGLSQLAWLFAEHRKPALRWSLRGSVLAVGAAFGVSVLTGPDYIWSFVLVFVGETTAVVWSMTRLNVTRVDPKEKDGTEEKETVWDRMGISKLTKFKGKLVHDEKTGDPIRIDVDVQHAPGETAAVFGDGNLAKMESATAAPPGLSSVVQDPNRADRSSFSIPLVDPFKGNIPVGPLSAPGKSIAEWITVGNYAKEARPARFAIAGGIHTPSPTSIAYIGMTRAGKTGTETQVLTEAGSRSDWVCLYLNQAKGLQDVRPLLPIIEAAVIPEDASNLAPYRVAIKQVMNIMAYRQKLLGDFGVSAWSPRCALPDEALRPSRVMNGKREFMPRVPFLTVHLGEADSLLTDHKIGENYIYLASKALSLGINTSTSLQKPGFKSMPTDVRSQIGLWLVHGLADSEDEDYVIDKEIREKGARPGKWRQSKPGQHFAIGSGLEDDTFQPVAVKTRFLIGTDRDENGRKFTFDELNDRYMAEMLRRNFESAKTQAKLDRGSADATGGWWDEQVAMTNELRDRMLHGRSSQSQPQSQGGSQPQPVATATASRNAATAAVPPVFRGKVATATAVATDEYDQDDEPTAEEIAEMHEEIAEMREVEGVELYADPAIEAVDLTASGATAPDFDNPEDDPLYDPEEEAKSEPATRGEMLGAMADAFMDLLGEHGLRDPEDSTGKTVLITPGDFHRQYRLRSRPWVYGEFSLLAEGKGELATRFEMTRVDDLGKSSVVYRLREITRGDGS